MDIAQLAGSVGVGLLLLAFVLNLAKLLSESDWKYLAMNLFGAGLAAWYAYAGGSMPFLVLESVWGMAALIRLIAALKKGSQPTS